MSTFLIDGHTISDELKVLAELGNKTFTKSLHPGIPHILGVRIPDLRKLAKRIVRTNWELYLSEADPFYMEERILQGLVLGYINPDSDVDVYLKRVTSFVRLINSWSVCDTFSFAGGKTYIQKHQEQFWEYLKIWMNSSEEYEVRFGVVMALKYFIDDIHINELLSTMEEIVHKGYYVRMAIAWAVSECFIKFPHRTTIFLHDNKLDVFTYNKTIQKIIESYRVDESLKQEVKLMKRKY